MSYRCAILPVVLTLTLSACSRSDRQAAAPAPAQPTGLVGQLTGPTSVTLFWLDNAANEMGYLLERAELLRASSGAVPLGAAALEFAPDFAELASLGADSVAYVDESVEHAVVYRYRVSAFNGNGSSDFTNQFEIFVPPPVPDVVRIEPNAAFASGGQIVSVKGAGFLDFEADTNTVVFGGVLASFVNVVDDNTITCEVPANTTGVVDVTVTNSNGTDALVGGFSYFAFPPVLADQDVRVDTDSSISASIRPEICVSGDRVYVAWEDRRNGDGDIYFNRSLDAGATWLAADVRVDTAPTGSRSEKPRLHCAGDNVYLTWLDDRSGGNFDVRFSRSTDEGATWSASDVRLNTDAPNGQGSWDPQMCALGDLVLVAWGDDRNGFRDIYAARSTDGGATWEAESRLDTDTPGAASSERPQIGCDDNGVYVVWTDYRSGSGQIFANRSVDQGGQWEATDSQVDSRPPSFVASSTNPQLGCDGNNVYVVWEDSRDGEVDVYFSRSSDAGATWSSEVRLDTDAAGAAASTGVQIVAAAGKVFVVWQDTRSGAEDVFMNRSLDGGLVWQAADRRLDTDAAGAARSLRPQVCGSGETLFVVWEDHRDFASSVGGDVYMSASADLGATWVGTDLRVDTTPAGASGSFCPQVACVGSRVFVVWEDYRNAGGGFLDGDIFVNRSVIQP